MDTFVAINQRRSIKAFDTSHPFTAAEVVVENHFS
jgi:hypothetical protein